MDQELREIEDQLEQLSPAAMPDGMWARMEQAMDNWQEFVPVEEKVVPFEPVKNENGTMKWFNAWASAAAVALVAAASYLVFSNDSVTELSLAQTSGTSMEVVAQTVPTENITNVVPASNSHFDTQVKRASNNEVTYDAKGRPVRIMQVEFEDEVTVRGKDGKIYKVKQPRIEYYAVPVEIH